MQLVTNAKEMIAFLEKIHATKSTNDKIALIKTQAESDFVKRVFDYAYNPFHNFFIKPFKEKEYKGYVTIPMETPRDVFELLDVLKSRSITGNDAHNAIVYFCKISVQDEIVLLDLILKRDLCCGISGKTINKAIPNLIPIIPYMRCSLMKDVKMEKWENKKIYSQIKADGLFVNAEIDDNGNVKLYTRNGSTFPDNSPALSELITAIKNSNHKNVVYHGELLVTNENDVILDRQTGNEILNSLLQGTEPEQHNKIVGLFWDIVDLDVFRSDKPTKHPNNKPYKERMELLSQTKLALIETVICDNIDEAKEHYKQARLQGYEGTVIKLFDALWCNTTSKEQVKLKAETIVELEVIGFKDGTGMNENLFGSITCKSSDDLLIVDVGVSGFTFGERETIAKDKDSYIGKIMAVKANSVITRLDSDKKSLFLPRFVEWRNDKDVADTLAHIENQFNSEM